MSYQIVEEVRNLDVCLVGLNERGYSIANMMKPIIEEASQGGVSLHQLASDAAETVDFGNGHNERQVLILVDDVIFSGGTMFSAVTKVSELSGFESIYVAVLVDRGHRKYPVMAGIVGFSVPTKLNEHVELQLHKNKPDKVILIEK